LKIVPLDTELGKRAGRLLARTKTRDVIDAAVALLAADGDQVLTSDVEDLHKLLQELDVQVDIVSV
jgi:hypothetical protein